MNNPRLTVLENSILATLHEHACCGALLSDEESAMRRLLIEKSQAPADASEQKARANGSCAAPVTKADVAKHPNEVPINTTVGASAVHWPSRQAAKSPVSIATIQDSGLCLLEAEITKQSEEIEGLRKAAVELRDALTKVLGFDVAEEIASFPRVSLPTWAAQAVHSKGVDVAQIRDFLLQLAGAAKARV